MAALLLVLISILMERLMLDLKMKIDMLEILEILKLEKTELVLMTQKITSLPFSVLSTMSLVDQWLYTKRRMILEEEEMRNLLRLEMLELALHAESLEHLLHSEKKICQNC